MLYHVVDTTTRMIIAIKRDKQDAMKLKAHLDSAAGQERFVCKIVQSH